ncbi:MAG TPA: CapA family protein [Propionibacteriaceae bacterium]|nr:CapA family protein [Propionibacteriaceae bacterium]
MATLRVQHAVVLLVAAVLTVTGCATTPTGNGSPSPSLTQAATSPAPTPTSAAPSPVASSTAPSAPATTPTPSPTPATTVTNPRTATITMSGDLLWHNSLWIAAGQDKARTGKAGKYDFDPMFAAIKPAISGADMAICHSEVPFAAKGATPTGYPSFAAPAEIAPWIKSMGWDLCTTASNHSLDQGFAGLSRTKDYYDEQGILTTGTWRTEAERAKPVIYTTAKGVKVGVVTGTYSLNGIPLPAGKPWSVSMLETQNLLEQAKVAKEAGADIVLVEMHGGDEYVVKPSAQQVQIATALTASPYVDMVFGEHVHVVQPITKINGKWVVYGLGNMIGQHLTNVPRAYEGITARFTFTEKATGGFEVSKAEYIPTYWNHNGTGPVRILLLKSAVAAGKGDIARYQTALDYTRKAVNALGAAPGLVES